MNASPGAEVATTLPPVPVDDKSIERDVRNASSKAVLWTMRRDKAIRIAVEQGHTLRQVAEWANLSHTAIKFIAKGR